MTTRAQIKMHQNGRITLQTLNNNNTEGVSIDPGPDWHVNFSGNTYFRQIAYFIRNVGAYGWTTCAKTSNVNTYNWIVATPTWSDVNFYVTGGGYISCKGMTVVSSLGDEKKDLKEQEPITGEEALNIVRGLEGYYYLPTNQDIPDLENNENVTPEAVVAMYEDFKKRNVCLSATNMNQVFPEGVRTDPYNRLCIDYLSVVTLLVEAVKAQQTEIEELSKALKENQQMKP